MITSIDSFVIKQFWCLFRESRHKINVTFHDDNNTVTYREDKFYVFDRDMSVGPEEDTFTTVNIPLMVLLSFDFL